MDQFNIFPYRMLVGQRIHENLRTARDYGQQVIKVVRDTAGEAPDSFQFLRLLKLPFEPLVRPA